MKKQKRIEELITELLVIKDIYICGRMNQAICHAVVSAGHKPQKSKSTWQKYEELSSSYVKDSIAELMEREEEILEIIEDLGTVSMTVVKESSYRDFDEELMNDMMRDYYGDTDSIGFASAYNAYSEDFNAFLSEFA